MLDLDETLVHSSVQRPTYPAKLVPVDVATSVWVSFRPYVRLFLEQLAPHYELVVWTAGTQAYGEAIVRELDPTGNLISGALYRQHCTYMKREKLYVKDLTFLGRDLTRVRLCDNNLNSFRLQRDRGILVPDFVGDPSDMYLLRLCHELIPIDDVVMQDCKASVSLSVGSGNTEAGGSELVSTPTADEITTDPFLLMCPTDPPTVLPQPDATFILDSAPDDDDPPISDAAPPNEISAERLTETPTPPDDTPATRLISPAPPDDDPDVRYTDPPSTVPPVNDTDPPTVLPEPDATFILDSAPDDDDPLISDPVPPFNETSAERLTETPTPPDDTPATRLISPAPPDDDPDVRDTDPPSTAVFIVTSPELVCGMYVDILRGSYKGKTGARVTKVMNKMVRVAIPGIEKERNIRMTSIQPR